MALVIAQQLEIASLRFHWINFDGMKLRVGVREVPKARAQQPPLVVLGGMGAHLEVLLPVAAALPKRVVLLFDPPGVGQSSTPHWPLDMHEYANLVLAVVDRLGHSQVDILGYSWGGALAQQFVSQHAQRCRRLVLAAAPAGSFLRGTKFGVMRKYLSPRRFIQPEYVREIAGDIYGGKQKHDSSLAIEYTQNVHSGNRAGYYLQLTAMLNWHSPQSLSELSQPTLILAGTDDPLIPISVAESLQLKIPGAKLEKFDDGHLFLLSQPEKVGAIIEAFLSDDALSDKF